MKLSKFCPRCGKETDKLYGEEKKLCADCYPTKHDLLDIPNVVEVEICSVCGRLRKHGEWLEEYTLPEQLGARFEEFSEEGIQMDLQYWEDDNRLMVRTHASKGPIKDSYDAEVRFNRVQCKSCSKFDGGFYKVKMQLRGDDGLEEVANEVVDEAAQITNKDRGQFVSNIERNKHGFNIFMSTEKMARKILSKLRARHDPDVKRSYELVGEEDGQEVYRNVISVRL